MARRAQLFVATHAGALSRADALDAGTPPQSETPHLDRFHVALTELHRAGRDLAQQLQVQDVEPWQLLVRGVGLGWCAGVQRVGA